MNFKVGPSKAVEYIEGKYLGKLLINNETIDFNEFFEDNGFGFGYVLKKICDNYGEEIEKFQHQLLVRSLKDNVIDTISIPEYQSKIEEIGEIVKEFNFDLFLNSGSVIDSENNNLFIYCLFEIDNTKVIQLIPFVRRNGIIFGLPFEIVDLRKKSERLPYAINIQRQFSDKVGIKEEEFYKMQLEVFIATFISFIRLNHLGLHFDDSIEELPEKVIKKSSNSKKNKNGRKKPNKIYKVRRFVISKESYTNLKERRRINRICESWSVCGHYRRYKSGKVVFVKPHIKGKNKDLVDSKNYQLYNKENKNDSRSKIRENLERC